MIPWPSYLKEEHKSEYELKKLVEECEDLESRDHTFIVNKGLSNQRTTWRGRRKSGEWRSGDSHIEWPSKIMGFIHARNLCQKEVITFSKLWEEEEARLIIREENMGAVEDQH